MKTTALALCAAAALFGSFGAAVLGGCGSTSSGSTSSSSSGDAPCYDYSGFKATTVSFKTDILPIFQKSCGLSSSCHSDQTPPAQNQPYLGGKFGDPPLTSTQIGDLMMGIVGAPSEEPGMSIVKAGDPANSYMMFKLDATVDSKTGSVTLCSSLKCNSTHDCLASMPQGGPELPLADRDKIRSWIANGAKND